MYSSCSYPIDATLRDRQYYSMYYSSSPRNSVIAVKYPKVCRLYKACISIQTMASKQGVHILCQMPCSGAYRRSRVLVFWVEVETKSGSPVVLQQSNHLVRGRDQMRCSRLEVHSSSPATGQVIELTFYYHLATHIVWRWQGSDEVETR